MKEIAEAINKVMGEVNWVSKNMTVWSWTNSYKWVADKDVKIVIRESMIKNGLSLLPIWWTPKIQIDRWEQEEFYQSKSQWIKTKQSVFTEIETRYILLHTSWESIEVYWYGQWVDSQDKGAGKAATYALKNTLLNMFLVPTWVDTDDTHSDDIEVPKVPAKKEYPKDDKPWFSDKEYDKMIDWVWSISRDQYEPYKNELKSTYKFSKEMGEKVKSYFDNL